MSDNKSIILKCTSDSVSRLDVVLKSTNGRDKLLRLSQYLSRTLASSSYVDRSNRVYYAKLTSDLSYIRKALRLLKSINHLKNIQAIIVKASSLKSLSLVSIMNVLKNLMYAMYLCFDNLSFLEKLLNFKIIKSVKNPAKLAPKFWTFAISFALIADTKTLLAKQKISNEKQISETDEKSPKATKKCAFTLCKLDPKLLKRVIWDVLDLYVAACASDFLGRYKVEHYAALAGFFTSVFGVQEVFGL